MKVKTSNTILYCQKWRETVRFYTDIVKLQVNFSNDWFVEFVLNNGARLSIANEERASVKSSGGRGITIALQINDSKIAHESLLKAGADPTPNKQLWGPTFFMSLTQRGIGSSFGRKKRTANQNSGVQAFTSVTEPGLPLFHLPVGDFMVFLLLSKRELSNNSFGCQRLCS